MNDLSEAEIAEILREEGLVVKPSIGATQPRRLSNSLSDHLDLEGSERKLQAILDGDDGDDATPVPKPQRSPRRNRRDRVAASVNSIDRPPVSNPAFLRTMTDSKVGNPAFKRSMTTTDSKTGKTSWDVQKLKSLDPQQAVEMLEQISNVDRDLAQTLIKSLKG